MMVAYRDESTYADSLDILGAGPLGGFTPSQIAQNQFDCDRHRSDDPFARQLPGDPPF
jgi:hypothetical protein